MPKSTRSRFSAKRKRKAGLRLLRGEPLDLLSRELGVKGTPLSGCREAFLEGGLGALRSRARDGRDKRVLELEPKLGQLTMDRGLLEQKVESLEAGVPLGRRRSRR